MGHISKKIRESKEGTRRRCHAQLNRIYVRDHGVCHRCKKHVKRVDASRDHIKPVHLCTREEARSDLNILLAHRNCNSARGDRDFDQDRHLMKQLQRRNNLTFKIGDVWPE